MACIKSVLHINKLLLVALLTWLFSIAHAQDELPLHMFRENVKPVREMLDVDLYLALKKEVNAHSGWEQLVKNKQLAIGLVDLSNPYEPRYAAMNGNEMMYAASLPKIAVLLAAMDAFEKGELEETEEMCKDLSAMISFSNNQASTRLIDLLGYDKIESVLTDPIYEFYDRNYGGGLWVGKRYASTGPRHPDPIKGLSHGATVSQVCRFYYLMVMGQLVNHQRSKEMLSIMVDPALHHKFVHTLDQVAPAANVYRKSGSWRTYHSDSVLVWGEDPCRRYILVALTEHADGEQIIRELVNVVEKVLDLQQ